MLRVERTKRRTPKRFSNRDNERLTAAGVTPAVWAAPVKLPASAARQNNSMLPSRMSSKCLFILFTSCIKTSVASLVYCCRACQYSGHETERTFLGSIPESDQTKLTRHIHMSKSDKTVVITGATSGIGLGLAEAFLKEGYNVVGTGRSTERLQATAAKLDAGDRFLGVAGDVGKPESATRVFEQAVAKYGKVDVLVNNAGIFTAKPFVQFTP